MGIWEGEIHPEGSRVCHEQGNQKNSCTSDKRYHGKRKSEGCSERTQEWDGACGGSDLIADNLGNIV